MTSRLKIAFAAVAGIGALVATAGYLFISLEKRGDISRIESTQPQPSTVESINLSEITYDAKTTIPGTGVTFSYPSKGYFGMGAKINTAEHFGTVFEGLKYFELVSQGRESEQKISVAIYKLGGAQTLEDVIFLYGKELPKGQQLQGYYEVINGTRYYMRSMAPEGGVNTFTADAIVSEHLLEVVFVRGFEPKTDGSTPELARQFLSGLDFNCPSDCSVNSAPVVNMDKYRYGNTE